MVNSNINKDSNKEMIFLCNTIMKVDKIKIEGLEGEIKEEKVPEENIEESVVEIAILRKQKIVTPNQIRKLERFKIAGSEQKKVEPNKIRKLDRFKIMGVVVKKKNEVNNLDNFRFSAIKKEENKILFVLLLLLTFTSSKSKSLKSLIFWFSKISLGIELFIS